MSGDNLAWTLRELESASTMRTLEKENALLREPQPRVVEEKRLLDVPALHNVLLERKDVFPGTFGCL
jgi:hypothetical protein